MTDQTNIKIQAIPKKEKKKGEDIASPVSSLELVKKAEALGIEYLETIDVKDIDKRILAIIPEDTARKFRMASIAREKDTGIIEVVMENPEDISALNALRFLAKEKGIKFFVSLGHPTIIDAVCSRYESAE